MPRYPAASECIKEGAFGEVNKMLCAAALETFRLLELCRLKEKVEGAPGVFSPCTVKKTLHLTFFFFFFFGEAVVLRDARKVHILNKPVPRVLPFVNLPPPKRH